MPVQQMMSGDWYQSTPKGWPRHGFEKRLGAILFGTLVMLVFSAWRFMGPPEAGGLSGLERFYVPHYIVNQAKLFPKMRVLYTVDRGGREHPTVPAEVVDLDRRTVQAGMIPLGLSDEALKRGAVKLSYPAIQVNHANLSRFFEEWVYEGRTLGDVFKPGFYLGHGRDADRIMPDVAAGSQSAGGAGAWATSASAGDADALRVQQEAEV